ncbi:MAG: RluA family pseudouridine synthase [Oscillospiraceae bacterium]|nr:RluA family pseudouridine synthase [Oscillospiraceae bacterium]
MNEQEFEFIIDDESVGVRIDSFLSDKLEGFTRSHIQKIVQDGGIKVNEKLVSKSYKLCKGDLIKVSLDENTELEITPQDIPLDIIYEDADLLVVNKPKGMVVHPAPGNPDSTLVNALLYHCKGQLSGINGVNRPGIVHRIDRDTSGILVIAKSDIAHFGLSEQFSEHSIKREYHAVVYGNIKDDKGTVNAPIGRHPVNRKQMAVTLTNSKQAVTHFEVLERFGKFTYIKCNLETGRTHQIRVHMASIGHPIAGDEVYGPKKVIKSLGGQCLHAKLLGFTHPATGKDLVFDSSLPPYFTKFIKTLGNELF